MDVSIMWFRRDLRLADNAAAFRASAHSKQCLYVFIIDPWFFKQSEIGLLRVKFLFESLAALDNELSKYGNHLIILKGESTPTMITLIETLRKYKYVPHLYFNDDIQVGYGKERDKSITQYCHDNAVPVTNSLNYFLLNDELLMDSWWKNYYEYQYAQQYDTTSVTAIDEKIMLHIKSLPHIDPQLIATDLELQLPVPRQVLFVGGEYEARKMVYTFLKDRVDGYRWKISRPYLAQRGATSLLGPHLAFGTISNRTVFQAATNHKQKLEQMKPKKAFDIATYLDRLRWRDSFTQRLWFHPELMWQNRFAEFNDIYNQDPLSDQQLEYFDKWKKGETGFPLLDAAMKQLQNDGFINFRMRAMAATFLTINCGVSWHHGATHFMNCLVDGDIAINHWQWQMQAGITNPLSPTFRMYSPNKNLLDRDANADYVHFWLPETRGMKADAIIKNAKPMLDFNETRKINGKIISDIRKKVRERIINEKGPELQNANVARKTVINYNKYSADRYKKYTKNSIDFLS